MRGELGDFLADAGAVVGGATVLGATLGFIAGSIVHDFRPDADPERWARFGGLFLGTGGLVVFLLERQAHAVSVRTRKYVALAINVLLAVAVTQMSDVAGWSTAETYAIAGGVLVAFLLVALPWIDMAPDGALRRRTPR